MLKLSILIFALFFFPFSAFSAGSVVINEIAWMGTSASASDEWVELYNTTSGSIDLSGWTLSFFKPATTTASKVINLSGAISAGGYYLIERTDDTTVSDTSADLIATFGTGLVDTGMILKLDNNGALVDSSPELCDNKWCAGLSSPETTMERTDINVSGSLASNWASNNGLKINGKDAAGNNILGTPKSENSVYVASSNNDPSTPTPSPNQENSQTSQTNESSNSSSPSSSALPETFKVYAGEDKTVIAGQEIAFSGKVTDLKGNTIQNANFLWNFGDGATGRQRVLSHAFSFPGKYIVGLNAGISEESHGDYLNVEVLVPKIIISEAQSGQDGFIELLNETGQKLDIGGLVIKDGLGGIFSIPKSTILAQNALLVFPNAVTQIFSKLSDLALITSNGKTIDKAHFEVIADTAQSFVREGDKFVVSLNPSPGTVNSKITSDVVKLATSDVALVEKKAVVKNTETVKIAEKPKELEIPPPATSSTALAEQILPVEQPALTVQAAGRGKFAVNSKIFLGASVLAGILGVAGFFALRLLGRF